MSVFRLKVSYHNEPEVFRVIDIKGDQNFFNLHKTILRSVNFKEGELASFYVEDDETDDRKEICLSEMQLSENAELMNEITIEEIFSNPTAEVSYVYDFMYYYTFDLEMVEELDKVNQKEKYPQVVDSFGDPPLQNETFEDEEEWNEEDMKLFQDTKSKNSRKFSNPEDDDDLFGDFDDDLYGDEMDDFDNYSDDYDRYDHDDRY